jgi:signal transduction histidine kinase
VPTRIDPSDSTVAQRVHDLRNQLTVILLCAEGVGARIPRGLADDHINELRQCAMRASVLTRDLLLAAPAQLVKGPMDLNHVIELIAQTLSRLVGEGIGLRVNLWPEPLQVLAGSHELERILLNLVLNARDAMAGGGLLAIETAIEPRSALAGVDGRMHAARARLTVGDTGPGMTSEITKRMFEPFFTTKKHGTGLGLSSVALTVEQLDGSVVVDTEPGRGTVVSVTLPLAACEVRTDNP